MSTVLAYLVLSALMMTIGFGLRINQKINIGRILLISALVLLPTTAPLVNLGLPAVLICHFGLLAAFQLGIITSVVVESADHRKQSDAAPERAKDGN